MESNESFQPWLDSTPALSTYRTKPSPVASRSQPRAASRLGSSSATSASARPQRQASCSSEIHSGVASTVP